MSRSNSVAVLVVCYNHSRFIVECLESIRTQTHTPTRILIADDASTDDSDTVINDYLQHHPGFGEYYPNPANIGLTRTLNRLLDLVDCEYVTYISADDYMLPERIADHVALMQSGRFALVYSDALVVDHASQVLSFTSRTDFPWPDEPARSDATFATLLETNWIPAASFFLRTDILRAAGGYCEDIFYEDYELWSGYPVRTNSDTARKLSSPSVDCAHL